MPASEEHKDLIPRGIRNKNPGNVRSNPRYAWLGQVGIDDKGFIVNSAPEYGLRQILVIFHNYQEYHGLQTPDDLINRWAPSTENNVPAYVADMCQRCGVRHNQPIDIRNIAHEWASGIVHHECGSDPYDVDLYRIAIHIAFNQR